MDAPLELCHGEEFASGALRFFGRSLLRIFFAPNFSFDSFFPPFWVEGWD